MIVDISREKSMQNIACIYQIDNYTHVNEST